MANPFPGMNPYLEGPVWHTVHGNLIEEMARQLAPLVRPKYAVWTECRTVNVMPDPTELPRDRYPDVLVTEVGGRKKGTRPRRGDAAPLVVDVVIPEPVQQRSLQILRVASQELVTAIELLSPTNKRGAGRRVYERRRWGFLKSSTHFLEIDLLRVGHRFPVYAELPDEPYFVFLSRFDRRARVEVWPIPFDRPLPKVFVPLRGADGDATLDLQAVLTSVYSIYGYDARLDYSRPPRGRLSPERAAWVDGVLRAAGRRK